jgi:tetratricopeptide (TPR) repeat protein
VDKKRNKEIQKYGKAPNTVGEKLSTYVSLCSLLIGKIVSTVKKYLKTHYPELLNLTLATTLATIVAGLFVSYIVFNKLEIPEKEKEKKEIERNDLSYILVTKERADSLLQNELYKEAAITYASIIDKVPKSKEQDLFADISFSMGLCYLRVSEIENRLGNTVKSISFFENSLDIYRETYYLFPDNEKKLVQLITAMNMTGIAYRNLSEFTSNNSYLNRAITYHSSAVNLYNHIDDIRKDRNTIALGNRISANINSLNSLGTDYYLLSLTANRKANLSKAIEYYEEAVGLGDNCEYCGIDTKVRVKNDLASSYLELSRIEDRKWNLFKANSELVDCLRILRKSYNQEMYTLTKSSIAKMYPEVSDKDYEGFRIINVRFDSEENRIDSYGNLNCDEILEIFPFIGEEGEIEYAFFYRNCLNTPGKGMLHSQKDLIKKAIEEQEKATECVKQNDPYLFASMKYDLGVSLITLSSLENTEDNLKEAIMSFKESLNIWTIDNFPYKYAITNSMLSTAYLKLATLTKQEDYLFLSKESLLESIKILKRNIYPYGYAEVMVKLGEYYSEVYRNSKDNSYFYDSEQAFIEGLKIFSQNEFPEINKATVEKVAALYRIENLADPWAYSSIARKYLEMGESKLATRIVMDFFESNNKKEYKRDFNQIAWELYKKGLYSEALPFAERAVEIEWKGSRDGGIENKERVISMCLDTISNIHRELGENEEAMKEINKAIEIKPDHAFYYYTRALNYISENDIDNASRDLRKACSMDEDKACEKLERLLMLTKE